MRRIVIKVGSNVLTREDGTLDVTRMSSIVDQVVKLQKNGFEIVLVSSGAVACGRSMLKTSSKLDSVEQRQLFSAIGQVRLVNLYYNLFKDYGISIGQVLTMKESFSTRREYLNQRSCMEVMLQNKVIPIVNENDTVSVTELMFTDNDELSGLVASMMDADTLIILSNIDGIYNGSPKSPKSSVIQKVEPSEDLSKYIQTEKSGFGRGGMITKCTIARKVAEEGIKVMIANGKKDNILVDLLLSDNPPIHTEFIPNPQGVSSVKKWIAHSGGFAKGSVKVDDNAVKALKGKTAVSLLLVGVTEVLGEFEEGDIINIMDKDSKVVAVGKASYDSEEAVANIGKHDCKPLVHYNYLYLL
ncbi:MAG: glutamate 5-kinase [Bacteroidales bacterium]|nr:glutamate 5-kinase [Bacteroidales bacterium]